MDQAQQLIEQVAGGQSPAKALQAVLAESGGYYSMGSAVKLAVHHALDAYPDEPVRAAEACAAVVQQAGFALKQNWAFPPNLANQVKLLANAYNEFAHHSAPDRGLEVPQFRRTFDSGHPGYRPLVSALVNRAVVLVGPNANLESFSRVAESAALLGQQYLDFAAEAGSPPKNIISLHALLGQMHRAAYLCSEVLERDSL